MSDFLLSSWDAVADFFVFYVGDAGIVKNRNREMEFGFRDYHNKLGLSLNCLGDNFFLSLSQINIFSRVPSSLFR